MNRHADEGLADRLGTLVQELYPLDRDLVSSGYDAALAIISRYLPMQLHRYPSGQVAWTWTMPDRWELREGRIESLDGSVVVSSRQCSLHVARYSRPVDAVVDREELLKHVHTHPVLPDAVPYAFLFYNDSWAFCMTQHARDALGDAAYRVVIDAQRSPGFVTVGEVQVQGTSRESNIVIAHLDHPWQVNDDLTGVVAGVEVFRRLLARGEPLRYTWRLLLLPETVGSVAWLAERPQEFEAMHGALFLEMLGRPFPHKLQRSFSGTAHVDRVLEGTLRDMDTEVRTFPFRTVIGNDERQFNAPGVRVPCASMSRVRQPVLNARAMPGEKPPWPYDEYHSHLDDPEHCDFQALAASTEVLWQYVRHMEADAVLRNHFRGEIFLSRFGLDKSLGISWYKDPTAYKMFFDVADRIDGTRTISDIATELDIGFGSVLRIVIALEEHELVSRDAALPPRERD